MKVVYLSLAVCLLFAALLIATNQQEEEEIVFEEEILEAQDTPSPQDQVVFQQEQIVESAPIPPRQPFQLNLKTLKVYQNEVLAVAGIFLYLFLYIRGRRVNAELIERFYRKIDRYLQQNFAHIGFSKESGEDPFIGQSGNEAMYYATGRQNVDYIEMKFTLRKRQDALYYFLYELIFPERDIVTIDIPVKSQVPCVLLLAAKKKLKQLSQANLDVKKLAGRFNVENLNPAYQVLGETAESVDYLIDNYAVKRLNDMNGLFVSLHYTDQKMFSQNSGHIRCVLNISHKNPQQFLTALELLFHIADHATTMKISAGGKIKAQKARQAFNQTKEKEELEKHKQELSKKKQEKKRQEQAWLRSLPADKQKREDQKRKKKEMNKMLKGRTMKVM